MNEMGDFMRTIDLLGMALRNMVKRKLRTFLTVMGVVVGSAAITVMISLGVAVNMTFDQIIEDMGRQALRIQVHGPWSPMPGEAVLSPETMARISSIPDVEIAMPIVHTWLQFVSGRYTAGLQIMGMEPGMMEALGIDVAQGRTLDSDDAMAIVYSADARSQFRNPRNQGMFGGRGGGMVVVSPGGGVMISGPGSMGGMATEPDIDLLALPLRASFDPAAITPGEQSAVRPYIVDGVGIAMPSEDWMFNWVSFMPLEQVIEIEREQWRIRQQQGGMGMMFGPGSGSGNTFPLDESFREAIVIVNDVNNVERVADDIRALGFTEWAVHTQTSWINYQRESSEALQTLLASVGAVSLLIAAIGITNTMVMAIYERTKEIGVMKVIGATVRDVRRLFLVEAAIIGAVGGALGLALSAGLSYILNNFEIALFNVQQWSEDGLVSYIPLWLFGLAFAFSVVVGVVSGFLPARRATRISALAAIRTE